MSALSVLKKIKHKTRIRTRVSDAKKKAKTVTYIYHTNGAQGVSAYVKEGFKKRLRKNTPVQNAGDVLFVTIDNEMLNHYRVDHMRETLESMGVTTGTVMYYDLKPAHIKHYNTFVFYRAPWMPYYDEIFAQIRRSNKVSIYAVDDLVIDRKYTDNLPVVQQLLPEDRKIYDDGVERHGKLMQNCDYAITTTQALADELRTYQNLKEVYIDRNMRNHATMRYSDKAIAEVERDDNKVIIGYFSGTNTHNEDFQMVAPALVKILEQYDNVYIKLAGRLDAPDALKGFEDRLLYVPLVSWRRLPYEMRNCHINLSPLVDTLFNRAKSELKWADAALVGVPTVASNMGACAEVVQNDKTGILVENTSDAWYEAIRKLVENAHLREKIGIQAKRYVEEHYSTSGHSAMKLNEFLRSITPNIIAFAGVNIGAISGGNMVVKKHMDLLREAGNIVYGVEIMDYHENDKWLQLNRSDDKQYDIFRINSHRKLDKVHLQIHFDRYVATFWASVDAVDEYRYINKDGKKLYLVQNMEAGFYPDDNKIRVRALATYLNYRVAPITISKWCQQWLKDDFDRAAKYAPNGIDLSRFPRNKRNLTGRKIKVLIEGDSASEYKRVDESFEIANRLDKEKFKISYLSYNAEPKDWYHVDHTYMQIPYEKVGKIYATHDILLKSSTLESFSYPPLEMMATGGVAVLVKNGGNSEYIQDGVNAVYYEGGNIDDGVAKITELSEDMTTYNQLVQAGLRTAHEHEWDQIKSQIVALYD